MMSLEKKSKILVLGASGFIGSYLVRALLHEGFFVRCFSRNPPDSNHIFLSDDYKLEYCYGDFLSQNDLYRAISDCDVCYHLISTTNPHSSNSNIVYDVESNVLATVHFLNIAVKCKLKKIIFASSGGSVYGIPSELPITEEHSTNPICSYGITKLTIEKYLQLYLKLHGLDFAILRIANPFGERQCSTSGQGVVAAFLDRILRGVPIEIWGDGSVVRDYIYIDDVIRALVAVLHYNGDVKIFNIGSSVGRSLNDVIHVIEDVTNLVSQRHYLSSRVADVPANVLSISRAKRCLNWSPLIDFEDGLTIFAEWYRDYI